MANHTPGPWMTDSVEIRDSNGNLVTDATVGRGDMPYEEAQANARLIAAAPDLLATLEYLTDMVSASIAPNEWPEFDRSVRNARAAIRKAEGK